MRQQHPVPTNCSRRAAKKPPLCSRRPLTRQSPSQRWRLHRPGGGSRSAGRDAARESPRRASRAALVLSGTRGDWLRQLPLRSELWADWPKTLRRLQGRADARRGWRACACAGPRSLPTCAPTALLGEVPPHGPRPSAGPLGWGKRLRPPAGCRTEEVGAALSKQSCWP